MPTDGRSRALKMIVAIVQRGKADGVVSAAIRAGAPAATVVFGRGQGIRERLGPLGIAIQPEKEGFRGKLPGAAAGRIGHLAGEHDQRGDREAPLHELGGVRQVPGERARIASRGPQIRVSPAFDVARAAVEQFGIFEVADNQCRLGHRGEQPMAASVSARIWRSRTCPGFIFSAWAAASWAASG